MDANTDPGVIGALISLKPQNVVPPMNHGDREKIVKTFRLLVKSDVVFHPEEIYSWLIENGWMEPAASEVRRIAWHEKLFPNTLQDFLPRALDNWRRIGRENR